MKERKWRKTFTHILRLSAIAIYISNKVMDVAGVKCNIINDDLVFTFLIVFIIVLSDRLDEVEDRLKRMVKAVNES